MIKHKLKRISKKELRTQLTELDSNIVEINQQIEETVSSPRMTKIDYF